MASTVFLVLHRLQPALDFRGRDLQSLRLAESWKDPLANDAFPVLDVSGQLQLRKLHSARELSSLLLRECGVLVVPGEGFGSAAHVRLAYSVSRQELARGLQKLREFCLSHER